MSVHEGEQARGSLLVLHAISSDYRRRRSAGVDSRSQPRYSLTWYIAISRIPYRHMTRGKYYFYKRSWTLFGSPLLK